MLQAESAKVRQPSLSSVKKVTLQLIITLKWDRTNMNYCSARAWCKWNANSVMNIPANERHCRLLEISGDVSCNTVVVQLFIRQKDLKQLNQRLEVVVPCSKKQHFFDEKIHSIRDVCTDMHMYVCMLTHMLSDTDRLACADTQVHAHLCSGAYVYTHTCTHANTHTHIYSYN